MTDIPEEQLIKKGKMIKAPWTMTLTERNDWELRMQTEAKEYLFSIGQPLVYEKEGHMIAEYADGRIKVIR
ncbi:MAG: hypothetical protein JWR54_876 [Mucilaginibacter sp.]|nr:hypothetical protein [Mucilaginibacter sp.]